MLKRLHRISMTIRGQIAIIMMIALVTISIMGDALERWVTNDLAVTNLENVARELHTVANLLDHASAQDRSVIIASARRAGWDIQLMPVTTIARFKNNPSDFLEGATDWLFPFEGPPPLGGWRTFLDNHRVLAVRVDDDTIVMASGFSETFLTSAIQGNRPYYLVGFVVLALLLFAFAIRAITEPIQRIAHAAAVSDITIGSPVFEEKGTIEIVALARALNGMRRRIRLMLESRTRMLRGLGHDLRTPLTRLKVRIERMDDSSTKDALLSDIERIETLLVASLNFLRNDCASEATELVDVASILQTICSEFADVGHDVSYAGPNRLIATCRPLSISRAVTNLCDNAVKFAQEVKVTLSRQPGFLVIVVEDDGPGIPRELQERVLEPFFKVDQSRSQPGFGLGLSMVADIVQSHHGEITLEERKPSGLRVVLSLPQS
ncbi:ATP-binding protein [Neorhizobium sp. DT-125]|uniref:ATP-binding protein n=1 Tax=Neorhizobium sp. DT-125 TaxID=3396163 RepID=UPI003F1DF37A